MNTRYLFLIALIGLLTGCGEADYSLDQVSPTLQGKFLDNAVEGLEYNRSNGDVGITASGGYYDYKSFETLSFRVGALNLGSVKGASVITPRELADVDSYIEDSKVNNRVRFLMALDSDDQRIGIQIDEAMRERARSWEREIDFSLGEQAFVARVAEKTHNDITGLPSKSEATEHFAKSLRCAYSGAYIGAWDIPDSNESSGFVGVMLQANGDVMVMGDGQTVGDQNETMLYIKGKHNINNRAYTFSSSKILYYDRNASEVRELDSGGTISGRGQSTSYESIDGSFSMGDQNGSYHVTRSDSSENTAYRYTGFGYDISPNVNAEGEDIPIGMIMLDIDKEGNIYGSIHDMRNPMAEITLEGSVDRRGSVNIVVDMPEPLEDSFLVGTINFHDTTAPLRLLWGDVGVTYGSVVIDGCQLQAVELEIGN